jgi:hypothetical protein
VDDASGPIDEVGADASAVDGTVLDGVASAGAPAQSQPPTAITASSQVTDSASEGPLALL